MELFASGTKRTVMARINMNDFRVALYYGSGTEQSNPLRATNNSESSFSSWIVRLETAESTYTSATDFLSNGHIAQLPSPTSFLTQTTEAPVSSDHESTNISDQLATTIHMSSDSTLPPETRDSLPQLSSPPSLPATQRSR